MCSDSVLHFLLPQTNILNVIFPCLLLTLKLYLTSQHYANILKQSLQKCRLVRCA